MHSLLKALWYSEATALVFNYVKCGPVAAITGFRNRCPGPDVLQPSLGFARLHQMGWHSLQINFQRWQIHMTSTTDLNSSVHHNFTVTIAFHYIVFHQLRLYFDKTTQKIGTKYLNYMVSTDSMFYIYDCDANFSCIVLMTYI